jgi:hypothetical protein
MNKTLLSIIPTTVKIAKLLSVLCIFTGFQAYAAPITTIGNLSYDGTLISGDGRTYVGLDTLAHLTYEQTQDKLENDPIYANYRFAHREDADYFIGSLFGDTSDGCSSDMINDADAAYCGTVPGWYDGAFGLNNNTSGDWFWFDTRLITGLETGLVRIDDDGWTGRIDSWISKEDSNGFNVPWLLVDHGGRIAVPTPSSFAIFVLGFAGIGFARRRRS